MIPLHTASIDITGVMVFSILTLLLGTIFGYFLRMGKEGEHGTESNTEKKD